MTAYNTQEAARTLVTKEIRGVELAAGLTTTVDVLDIPAGASVGLIKATLVEEFGDATGAITALTAQVGDEDDPDGFITAKSVLDYNSPVAYAQSDGAYATLTADAGTAVVPGSFKLYTAAKKLQVLFIKTGVGSTFALFTKGRLKLSVEIVS